MNAIQRTLALAAVGIALAGSLVACTDQEVVFRDREVPRELFIPPDSAANGFLGYFELEEKLTTCGNCHVGTQADWVETAHADAWDGLQESGAARDFCEGCHTVTELGNTVTVASGFNSAPNARYHDVQCESCHGPGLNHVQIPDAGQPLANLAVGLDLTFGCGECHQGNHHGFVNDWLDSKHAAPWGEFFPGGIDAGGAAALRPECQSCHLGQGVLRAWGVEDSYVEAGAEATSDDRLPITCGVCHDPHGSGNEAQLRFPINVASAEEHLCARCHNRRTAPDPSSRQGLEPHAPEVALLQGDVGWFPPDLQVDRGQIIATHGTEANPGLCATCHVNRFEVTDQETGEFVFSSTGHNFVAAPCVDADGVPTAEDCELTEEARSFNGCTGAGCHGTEQAAFSALFSRTGTVRREAERLREQLLQVDPNLDDSGGEIDPTDPTFTVAEGAFFNLSVAEFPAGSRVDPRMVYAGSSAHNPFLITELLLASQDAVEAEYGVAASRAGVETSRLSHAR